MFYSCTSLEDLNIINLKSGLELDSSPLLTLDSLINICKECINTGSSKTLTLGQTNLDKLVSTYVKFTDESITEISVDEKGDITTCASTDSGAMLITDYMALKK
jgi:hypothetical protein